MIAVIDYGVGNLFSLTASLKYLGAETVVTNRSEDIEKADRIILPGVGAFEDAAAKLRATGLVDTIMKETAAGKPLLGICLGMQLLFEKSYEYGVCDGLGLIKGEIKPIADVIPKEYKIPHIGWNSLEMKKPSPIFENVKDGEYVYFVHSYYAADCEEAVTAVSDYGAKLTAAVQSGNIFGCQFHPEKSGETGLNILRSFVALGEGK